MQKRRTDPAIEGNQTARAAWLQAAALATVVLLLDQATKSWAENTFFDEPLTVWGPLRFTLVYNEGVAFGIGSGVAPIVLAAVVLVVVIFVLGRHITVNRPTVIGTGLVIGGAVGNLYDRLFRDHGGAVVDFIDVGAWPVFNLADVGVVVGALLLAMWGTKTGKTEEAP